MTGEKTDYCVDTGYKETTEGRKFEDLAGGRQEDSRWEDHRDTSSLDRSCLNVQYKTPSVLLN